MAIQEISVPSRWRVGWLDSDVPTEAAKEFQTRGFEVERCTQNDLKLHSKLASLAAVVFTQDQNKPVQIAHDLVRHANRLLDYDCRIIVRSLPLSKIVLNTLQSRGLPTSVAERSGVPPLPHVSVYIPEFGWSQPANFVANHPAGPAPSPTVRITVEPSAGRESYSFREPGRPRASLLRRAFSDCADVHLHAMDDGRSGAAVYRAHAELAQGQLGPWPSPFFVKIGPRQKIYNEYKNYLACVHPYIPFHLGPRLVLQRCGLGAHTGVIVGDYVDESESLNSCAIENRAAAAISCLFDRTLHGWYRAATPTPARLMLPKSISDARFACATKLGASLPYLRLVNSLKNAKIGEFLVGQIHGDLHVANVRVRANDAIVIDFLQTGRGPLLRDAAFLEASLLVDGSVREGSIPGWSAEQWIRSVKPLYDATPFCIAPLAGNPKHQTAWFFRCVRQIRHYAQRMELESKQYAAVLAAVLLYKASKDPEAPEPKASVKAGAYALAELIITRNF